MQIRTGTPPYVPYNAPMPHACKQVLNSCPMETMHIVVFLLLPCQSLSTDKGPYHMEALLVCTIHGANLIIHLMPLYPFGPLAIPNENIHRCSRGQQTNPNDVAKTINGNCYFIYTTGISGAQQKAEVLCNPCVLGDPQTKGDEIRIGCLTPAFSRAPKRAEYLSAEFHQWGVGGGGGLGFLVLNNG